MLNIAVKAARAAGSLINRASLDVDVLQVSTKNPNDFVTEVDRAAEAAIIETLLTAYPDHGILAEESGRAHGNSRSDFQWIIDPLDGTTNFIHGLPVYAVSIALAVRGKLEQAVVYDPSRNDMFYATRGRGAFLNDRRLRVSKRIRLKDALIGTGFPFRRSDDIERYFDMARAIMPHCAGLRRPGAASLDLCYVAAGWYDGFFENGLSPWDVAAGSLIITEAGGLVGNFTGEADYIDRGELVAGNPRIYGHLVKVLAPFSRVSPPEGIAAPAGATSDSAVRAMPTSDDTAAPPAAPRPRVRLSKPASAEAEAQSAPQPTPERKPTRIKAADLPPAPSHKGAGLREREREPRRDARAPRDERSARGAPGGHGHDARPARAPARPRPAAPRKPR